MSSSKSNPPSGLAPKPEPSNTPPNSDKNQAKGEAGVLLRQADNEGWSDEKLTKALIDNAAKSQRTADTPSAAPTPEQVESEEQSEKTNSEWETLLARRQETNRIIRQAEMEGWTEEKLLAALRSEVEAFRSALEA